VLARELAGAGLGADPAARLRAYERARYPRVRLLARLTRLNPANWRIPPLIGRLLPETSQTGMLARYSNRLAAAAAR
jgi:FAD-dependent urate hydroxylase